MRHLNLANAKIARNRVAAGAADKIVVAVVTVIAGAARIAAAKEDRSTLKVVAVKIGHNKVTVPDVVEDAAAEVADAAVAAGLAAALPAVAARQTRVFTNIS